MREAKLETTRRAPASKKGPEKKSVERSAKSQPSPPKATKKAPAPAAKKPRRG
jgi:hypothetical protein